MVRAWTAPSPGYWAEASPSTIVVTARQSCFSVQGTRFDPDGDYVRRWVPELAALRGAATHNPDAAIRRAYDYPAPIVDHHEAVAEYKDRLARQ